MNKEVCKCGHSKEAHTEENLNLPVFMLLHFPVFDEEIGACQKCACQKFTKKVKK